MKIKIEPPHITGTTTAERLEQLTRYVWMLVERLNMEQEEKE